MAERVAPRAPASLPNGMAFPTSATAAAGEDLHELRVRVPVDLHRQLLALKVLRGQSIAETVSLALEIYFQERARETEGAAHA